MMGARCRLTDENEKKKDDPCKSQVVQKMDSAVHRLTHFLVVSNVVYSLNNKVQLSYVDFAG